MKKLLIIPLLILALNSVAQTIDSSLIFNIDTKRKSMFVKTPNVIFAADTIRSYVVSGQIYTSMLSGVWSAENLGIIPGSTNWLSRLQAACNRTYVKEIKFTSDSSRVFQFSGKLNALGVVFSFENGCYLRGQGSTDTLTNVRLKGNYRDRLFDNIRLGDGVYSEIGEYPVMWNGVHPDSSSASNMDKLKRWQAFGKYRSDRGLYTKFIFQEGVFWIRRTGAPLSMIAPSSFTSWVGAPNYGTTLKLDTAADALINFARFFTIGNGVRNVEIANFIFDGSNKYTHYDSLDTHSGGVFPDGQNAFIFSYSSDSTNPVRSLYVHDCIMENSIGDGLVISKNSVNTTVERIKVGGNLRQQIGIGGGFVRGVQMSNIERIRNKTYVAIQEGGHDIHAEPADPLYDINISHCNLNTMALGAVYSGTFDDITTTDSTSTVSFNFPADLSISKCKFAGLLQITPSVRANIRVLNNSLAGVSVTTVSGYQAKRGALIISQNTIQPKDSTLGFSGNNVDSIDVSFNHIFTRAAGGIQLANMASPRVVGNEVTVRGTGNYANIYIYNSVTSDYGKGVGLIDGNYGYGPYRFLWFSNRSDILGNNTGQAPTFLTLSGTKIFPYRTGDGKQSLAFTGTGLPTYKDWAVGDIITTNTTTQGEPTEYRCDTAGALHQGNWNAVGPYYRNAYVRDSTNGRIYRSKASNGQNELPSADTDNTYWEQVATRTATFKPTKFNGLISRGTGSPEGVVIAPGGSVYFRADGDSCTSGYIKTTVSGNTGWRPFGCGGSGGGLSIQQAADLVRDSLIKYQGLDTLAYSQSYNNDSLKTSFTTKDGTTEVSTFIPRSSVPVLTSTNFASFTGFQRLSPDGNTVFDIMDVNTGENITVTKATTFYGVTITDAMVDSVLVFKKGSSYYIRNFTGPVSAAWYGVKADGTDEWAKLQKAYNATPKNTNLYIKGKVSIGKPLSMVLGKGIIGDAPQLTHIKKHANSTEANIISLVASGNTISMDSTTEIKNLTLDGNRSFIVNTSIRDTGLYVRNISPDGDMRIVVDNVNIINTSSAGTYLSGRLGGIKFNKNEFLYNKVGMVVWSTDGTFTGVSVGRSDSIGIANRNANNRWNTISIWGLDQTYGLGWLSTGKRTQVNGMQLQEIKSVAAFINDESSIYNNVFVDRTLDSTNGLAVRFDCRSVTFNGKITDLKAETYRWQSRTRYAVDVDKAVYSTINIEVDELGSRSVYDGWFTAPRDSGTIATVNHIKFGRFTFPAPTVSQVSDSAQIAIGRDTATLRSATDQFAGALAAKDFINVNKLSIVNNFAAARLITKLDTTITYKVGLDDFRYDPSDVSSGDDSAMVIVTAGGARLKRILGDVIYPEFFGAVGDGITDDSWAFNKMFRWIEKGRRYLYKVSHKNKQYLLNDTIFLPRTITGIANTPRLTIEGYGVNYKRTTPGVMLYRIPAPSVVNTYMSSYALILRGVEFTGDLDSTQTAIKAGVYYGALIEDCHFANFDTAIVAPFWLGGEMRNNKFTTNKSVAIKVCTGVGYWAGATNAGSAFNANRLIQNRVFSGNGAYAGLIMLGADGTILEGNIFEGFNPRYDIYIDAVGSTAVNGNKIRQTWFESTGGTYSLNTSMYISSPNTEIDGLQNDHADTLLDLSAAVNAQRVDIRNIQFIHPSTKFSTGGVNLSGRVLNVSNSPDATMDYFFNTSNWVGGVIGFRVTSDQSLQRKSTTDIVLSPAVNAAAGSRNLEIRANILMGTDNTYQFGRVASTNTRPQSIYVGSTGIVINKLSTYGIGFGDAANAPVQYFKDINDSVLQMISYGALRIPRGTTAQRPGNYGSNFRYNLDDNYFEGNNGSGWKKLMYSPFTTNGDLMYWNGTAEARLGVGSTGQILKVSGGLPSWQNEPVYSLVKNSTRDSIILRKDGVQIGAVKDSISSGGTATSSTFTSTLTNTTNINSSLFNRATYIKVDNIVNVSMNVQVTPTDSATAVELTFTLPFSTSNTSQSYIGSPSISDNGGAAYLTGEISIITGTTGKLRYVPTTTGTGYINITYQYSTN